ncbi:UDP-galactose/UDP-N-acetylglucosamine transporter srf-3 [Diaphorina citri]|uniref:UDP-galactose/UDP-N-acetylglucosamine transporter srf-3 n=1 Tax=Diaphorina citri TaxID=121845 RepID=A0A3Q0JB59_DIACI|nr:UDP-galactose/UDP-N-acetylglucosamine transporter srf-3 [Diaphorina citri]XP_026685671.1 UDP-galactose/UDP-N-acetylglucosamine transporter srf-3 [Diaphorina citri]
MAQSRAFMLKTTSLITLTLQNAIVSLSMRYARMKNKDELFISSTGVLMAEVVKLVVCLGLVFADEGFHVGRFINLVRAHTIQNPLDTLKVGVPALLYVIQNNLLYISASNLDAATSQVTYQLKILTTAIFAIILLKKKISKIQWISLVILVVGVALVQLSSVVEKARPADFVENRMLGFAATILACLLSGLAGVYFEMILKGSDVSIWMRNVQLSLLSLPCAACTCFISDWDKIFQHGFFYNYTWFIVFLVLLNASGGLIVAVVVKYADNILKGFATSLAIVLACVFQVYLFAFVITFQFIVGAFFVMCSVFLYSRTPSSKPKPPRAKAEV